MTTHKQWSTYAEEAKVEDFVLEVDGDDPIVFTNPSATALLRIAEGVQRGDIDLILTALCGDNYDRVYALLGSAGHSAMAALTEDLMDHFNLYDPVSFQSPTGKRLEVTRPTEARKLVNQGWRPVGEL